MCKRSLIIAVALVSAVFLTGCRSSKKDIRIGIVQLVKHPALDNACKGFVNGLAEAGYVNGRNIVIDYQNAQGEKENCTQIVQKFVNDGDSLILAIATSAAQAAAKVTKDIPILVTAVTDPESAELVKSNLKPGTNVSGTSDLTPCAAQIDLLKKILPDAEIVGMLYCSSEQNSQFQIALAKTECDKLGLKYIDSTVSNANEILPVTQSLVGKVDAIYVPTDNMIAVGMSLVAQIANKNKIPVIVGGDGMVKSGGLATYGINYYKLGKQTAVMAVDILKNGKNPADMPIEYLTSCDLKINHETEKKLGIRIPAGLK